MKTKQRKPWIAGLISFIWPGIGHIYCGEAKRGIMLYFFLLIAIPILCILLLLPFPRLNLILFLIAIPLIYFFIIKDAVGCARRASDAYLPKFYNKWYFYLVIVAIYSLVMQPIVQATIRQNLIQAFKIPSGGMSPSLYVGDHILVDKFSYNFANPKRIDIIVFKYPKDESRKFVKRIIGLPGEKLEIKQQHVFINDQLLSEPYAYHQDVEKNNLYPRDNFGPITINEEHVFVMGDNRENSQDSRYWGLLPFDNIDGKVKTIYWSWDSQMKNIRWERVGSIFQ